MRSLEYIDKPVSAEVLDRIATVIGADKIKTEGNWNSITSPNFVHNDGF